MIGALLLTPVILDIGDIGESIIGAFTDILSSFVDMIVAIPDAIARVFSGWATTVGSTWYGPIIAAITIIGFVLIIYGGFMLKNILLE